MTRPYDSKHLPIILALDGAWRDVRPWVERLGSEIWGFKVGSILFAEEGPRVIEAIQKKKARVFLDLKFHDIPNTVQGAVKNAFSWGVNLVTVHAAGGKEMLNSIAPLQNADQTILAITVLTSMNQADLEQIGVKRELKDQVLHLAQLAVDSGIKGLVCSPQEVSSLRKLGSQLTLVTPGVRYSAETKQDQKRTDTVEGALTNGASLVVLGRALTAADDWKGVWKTIVSSLDGKSFAKP